MMVVEYKVKLLLKSM